MRAEPRLVLAPSVDIGDDAHLVAVDFAFERRVFIDRERGAAEVGARAVLIKMEERAQLRIAAAVGPHDVHAPLRVFDLLRRDHTGLAEGELIRTVADALVTEPIRLGRPVTEWMAAGRALDRFDALDRPLPTSAEHRRQHRLWRNHRHLHRRRRRCRRRRRPLLMGHLRRNLHLRIRGRRRRIGCARRGNDWRLALHHALCRRGSRRDCNRYDADDEPTEVEEAHLPIDRMEIAPPDRARVYSVLSASASLTRWIGCCATYHPTIPSLITSTFL